MKRYGILILSTSLTLSACGAGGQVSPPASIRATTTHFPFASVRVSQTLANTLELIDQRGTVAGTATNDLRGATIQFNGHPAQHFVYGSTSTGASTSAVAYIRGGVAFRVQQSSDSFKFTMAGRGGDSRSLRTATVALNQVQPASGSRRSLCLGSAITMYLAAIMTASVLDMMDLLGLDYASLTTDPSNPNAIAVTLDGQTQYWDNLVLGLALSDLAQTNPAAYAHIWDDVNTFLAYGKLVSGEITDKHCLATDT